MPERGRHTRLADGIGARSSMHRVSRPWTNSRYWRWPRSFACGPWMVDAAAADLDR